MSLASANSRNVQMADINITPLVDVMLVLLVIFMIALPALTQRLPFELPQAGPQSDAKIMQLMVDAGDVYRLDGIAISRADLGRQLAAAATRTPAPVLQIRVSPEAEYDAVVQGMATARKAGIEDVVMADR